MRYSSSQDKTAISERTENSVAAANNNAADEKNNSSTAVKMSLEGSAKIGKMDAIAKRESANTLEIANANILNKEDAKTENIIVNTFNEKDNANEKNVNAQHSNAKNASVKYHTKDRSTVDLSDEGYDSDFANFDR